jgi:hypothetical protein
MVNLIISVHASTTHPCGNKEQEVLSTMDFFSCMDSIEGYSGEML